MACPLVGVSHNGPQAYLRQRGQSAQLWPANSFASSQPTLSVSAAAVEALMALPKPGIQPTSTCETARPTVAAVTDASAAAAALWDGHGQLDGRDGGVVAAGQLRQSRTDGGRGGGRGVDDGVALAALVGSHGGGVVVVAHVFPLFPALMACPGCLFLFLCSRLSAPCLSPGDKNHYSTRNGIFYVILQAI